MPKGRQKPQTWKDTVTQHKQKQDCKDNFRLSVSAAHKSVDNMVKSANNDLASLNLDIDLAQIAAAITFGVPELLRLSQLSSSVPYEWSSCVRHNCLEQLSTGAGAFVDSGWDNIMPRLEQSSASLAFLGPPTG